jgi:hypothetical protein
MTQIDGIATTDSRPEASAERLQTLLEAPCVVRLSRRKGRFTACIPEMGILVSAATADLAHDEALSLREARIREFAAEGMLEELPTLGVAQACAPAQESLLSRLKVFLIKAAVVMALFLYMLNSISSGLRDSGYILEKRLQGLANWTPDKVEWHRERAQMIAEKLGPTIRELMVMFDRAPQRAGAQDNGTAGQSAGAQ